jgi:glycosyltransferase involved in cell wall biosynthesis
LADLSSRRFSRKRRLWSGRPITVVSPSRWLAAEARKSAIFEGHRIEVLRNGLDLKRYQPLDRGFARQALGLPPDKRLVLFGSINPGTDSRKGYDLLQTAIGHLAADTGLASALGLVVFGSNPEREDRLHGLPAFHMGQLSDDQSLALLYAACDVFVAPSRQDNLPNTVAEALACGVPCVAFNLGGLPDLIEHARNGYLAQPFEAEDLARGIAWCLDTAGQRWQGLCAGARRFATEHLDLAQQAARHVELYRDILETDRTQR